MLSRLSDALTLLLLRTGERIQDLSSFGKAMLGLALIVVLAIAAHYGLIHPRHRFTNIPY